jgi:DnaJ domain
LKTYYELLGVEPDADPETIKRAFRREIARYHPDKVQHLGPEFQEIAASRAAELTEAYRILMNAAAREDYDETLARGESAPQPYARAPKADTEPPPSPRSEPSSSARPPHAPPPGAVPESLRETQATLSTFVRKATIGRLREAVKDIFGEAEAPAVNGFDAAFVIKPKRMLFQKAESPVQLLARVVPRVDGSAVAEAWPLAVKAAAADGAQCLLLLGMGLAPSRELASTIAEQRRYARRSAPVIVPVDTRDWQALIPPETPSSVRKLLDRLKLAV